MNLLDRVDHLIYATPELGSGIEEFKMLLGVRATDGGPHPGRGTRNALISVGPRTYIEIVGPDPEQPAPSAPRLFGIDTLLGPRLVTWAASAHDLASVVRQAATHGIGLGSIRAGSRRRPDGVLLNWQCSDPQVVVADRIVPFFIDWGETQHPATSSVSGGRLVALRAEHPDPERVQATLAQLGLDMEVRLGEKPALIATIETRRRRIELR